MLNVAVLGAAGRMGRALVEAVVSDPETRLSGALEAEDCPLLGQDAGLLAGLGQQDIPVCADMDAVFAASDAAIDFTAPAATLQHAEAAVKADCALVIGTTGFSGPQRQVLTELGERGKLVIAPNMSVGVNLLFFLCNHVAKTLGDGYDIEVAEMHHRHKKDAPSGTAARMAEILAEARGLDPETALQHGREGAVGARPQDEIGVHALRGGDVVGEHTVTFASDGERVELTHKASSRSTFAGGAVRAVKFAVQSAPGVYDMQDVLGLR